MSDMRLIDILVKASKMESSDVHISPGIRPRIRIDSKLIDSEFDVVTQETMNRFIKEIISVQQWEKFVKNKELDFSFGHPEVGRFRVNAYLHREQVGLALRILPFRIRSFAEIGMSFHRPLTFALATVIHCGAYRNAWTESSAISRCASPSSRARSDSLTVELIRSKSSRNFGDS